jgi:hypothetical protein
MSRLIADVDMRRFLVERGYGQVSKFSWARAAQQVLEVLESVGTDCRVVAR